MSNIPALEARRGQILEQISDLLAIIAVNKRELQRLAASLPFATNAIQRQQIQGNITRLKEQIAADEAKLASLYSELAEVDAQIRLATEQSQSRVSAGQTVAQAQRANDDRAEPVAPDAPAPPLAGYAPTNADRFLPNENVGTDEPLRPIENTQAIPPITANPGPPPPRLAGINGRAYRTAEPGGPPADASQQARDDALPTQQQGVGSAKDDATGGGGAGVTARINSLFGGEAGRIIPQGNALDAFASYTYSVSIYMLSSADYKTMLRQKTPPRGWQLLIQSGGAPVAGGQFQALDRQELQQAADGNGPITEPNLGRNQFFPLDFYIDDLVINHLTPNKGPGSPHSATNLTFKIYEPNGITFLPNLYRAVQQYVNVRGGPASVTQNKVYSSQNFLMVIRFYGYDANGNLVTVTNSNNQITSASGTVLQSAGNTTIEKYIPFQFTDIKFKVANRITEYECSAVCPQNRINTNNTRGIIPYNIELASQSLQELLTGPINFVSGTKSAGAGSQVTDTGDETARLLAPSPAPTPASPGTGYNPRTAQLANRTTTAPTRSANSDADAQPGGFYGSAPPKADAATRANSLTISQGLQEALNRFQAEISGPEDDKPQLYPDIYEIVIEEDILKNATLVPPGEFNPRQSAMIKAQTAKESVDGATQSVDTLSKNKPITAGTPIVQAIDLACRTSSYVLEQQLFYIDSVTGQRVDNANPIPYVAWYRIGLEAEPTEFYDTKRQDWQYRIKYSIAPYQVNQIKTDYFPRTQFQGTHKVYNYWFTGENTQVLDFQQDFNYLYYITQNAGSRPKRTSNYLEADRFYYSPLSNESSQGQENMEVYEGSAGAAAYLYSPADQSEIKLTLVGDPAWIFQGEVWSGIQGINTLRTAFLSDGTINPDGREVLFEVVFNQPVDYDLSTGLMDPGQNNLGTNTASRQAGIYSGPSGLPRERYIYQARQCTSYFRQGKFTQQLEGVLKTFPLEDPAPAAKSAQKEKQDNINSAASQQSQSRVPVKSAMSGRTYTPPNGTGRGSLANRYGGKGAKQSPPLIGDSFRTDDFFPPAIESPVSLAPQSQNEAPTSSTQVVGTAASPIAPSTIGPATGRDVGSPPTVPLYLNNNQVVQVSSVQEIQSYSGQASAQARLAAAGRLSVAQRAANNPISTSTRQVIARET